MASFHLLRNQVRDAFLCYADAAKAVPESNLRCKDVLARKTFLAKELRKHNSLFLNKFPYHVLSQIFSYLSPREYGKFARTCKRWYEFLKDWSPPWLELDLKQHAYPNFRQVRPDYIRHSLRKVELSGDVLEVLDKVNALVSAGCCRIKTIGEFVLVQDRTSVIW